MFQRLNIALGLLVLAAAFAIAQSGRTVQVEINYTGSGTVDANHKLYVALWDSPDFNGNPTDVKALESKHGTVTFTGIQKSPVFVSTAYDPNGKWDAQSPPPSGSSIGMYSTKPPTPEPIAVEPGKTAKVKLAFNDAQKVQ